MKSKKVRLTYALTSNVDGSEKLPPMIIGKAQKPRTFHKKTGAQLGFYYQTNAKVWMTAKLYQEWILDWDHKLRAQGRHILLYKTTSLDIFLPKILQTSVLKISHPILLHTSSQWTKASSNVSKPTTAPPSYTTQSTIMTLGSHLQKYTTSTSLKPCTSLKMLGWKLTQPQSGTAGRRPGSYQ